MPSRRGPRARARRRLVPGSRPRRGHVQHRRHRRSGPRALRRPSRLQLRRRRRRCADGDYACDPRRGSHLEHAAAGAPLSRARFRAAALRAPVAGAWARITRRSRSGMARRRSSEFRERGYLPEALTNYLALIGWSPRSAAATATMRADADGRAGAAVRARGRRPQRRRLRSREARVDEPPLHEGRVAGADGGRVARFFQARGFLRRKTDVAMAYLESLLPMAVGSVDRLEEIPDRLAFLFDYDAAGGAAATGGRRGAARTRRARGDRGAGRGDRRRRCSIATRSAPMANRVKEKTGQKGKALFHPIRVALTGEGGGPELDLAVPAIDRGAQLPRMRVLRRILERAASGPRRSADARPSTITVTRRPASRRMSRRARDHLRHQSGSRGPARGAGDAGCGSARAATSASTRSLALAGASGVPSSARTRRHSIARRAAACTRASSPRSRTRARLRRRGSRARRGAGAAAHRRARRHRGSAQRRRDPADRATPPARPASSGSPPCRVRSTASSAKASAGALAHVRIATVVNIARAIEELKEAGRLDHRPRRRRDRATTTDVDWTLPSALVLGAEGTGLRRLVRERCDRLVAIPMRGTWTA